MSESPPPAPATGAGSFRERAGASPTSAASEWGDAATLPLVGIKELFVTLAKALRAVQLYDENNPVYRRFVQSLREALGVLFAELDRLVVTVEEDRLTVVGQEVYRAENRSESLAFLFFKDGIREITFLPGLEVGEELTRFLRGLQRARKGRGEGDDLLTILWEADLTRFRYQYVDVLAEAVELPEPGQGSSLQQLQTALRTETAEPPPPSGRATEAQQPSGALTFDHFNPTLYSLDPREMDLLRQEVAAEAARDLRGDVLSALFDRLEEPQNPERQSEILATLRALLPNFLSRGVILPAARVLEELRALGGRVEIFDEQRRQEADRIVERLSTPQTMQELVYALEDGSIKANPAELGMLLRHLEPGALGPLLRASELTEIRELQPVLRQAVHGIAEKNPAAVAVLLRHDDPVVLAGAARLAGRLKATAAGPKLAALMVHPVANVRLAAVEAAVELKASTAASAVQNLLGDADRQVRIAAARGLGKLKYRPAAPRFREVVTGKDIRNADLSEKIAFFESYGELGGDGALELMDKLLNGRGFLGRREPPEIRACAALALGKLGTEPARRSLQAAAGEEDAVVRSAVSRALRGEENA